MVTKYFCFLLFCHIALIDLWETMIIFFSPPFSSENWWIWWRTGRRAVESYRWITFSTTPSLPWLGQVEKSKHNYPKYITVKSTIKSRNMQTSSFVSFRASLNNFPNHKLNSQESRKFKKKRKKTNQELFFIASKSLKCKNLVIGGNFRGKKAKFSSEIFLLRSWVSKSIISL